MLHHCLATREKHPDDVEPIRAPGAPVAVHPDARRPAQLALFPPGYGFHRLAKPSTSARLDLDEGNRGIPLHDQVDVSVPTAKPTLHHAPAPLDEPPLGDSFSERSECLPRR